MYVPHIVHEASEAGPSGATVTQPPQVIHTSTETVSEVAIQVPSTPGSVLQFVEKQGKVITGGNGQEVEVPNITGNPEVNELRFSTTSTAKIDVTEMANAQARLIANQELEKQAAVHKKEIDKEKSARKKERMG